MKFLRFLLWVWCLLGIICLVGMNQVFIGSAFALLRWPLVILALVLFWRKKSLRQVRIFQVVLVLMGLWMGESLYRGIRYTRDVFVETKGTELTIASYNVFFLNKYKQNIIQEIKKENPEVLLLQEYTPGWQQVMSASIFKRYPYRRIYPRKGPYGLAILSQYPIKGDRLLLNDRQKPIAQYTQLKVKGKSLHLLNIHLSSPAGAVENPEHFFSYYLLNYDVRKTQWKDVLDLLKNLPEGEPVLIGGDFNTMRWEPLYRDIRFECRDLFRAHGKGWRGTFPHVEKVPVPPLTLDYLMLRGPVKGKEAYTMPGSSADHLGLWGKVEL